MTQSINYTGVTHRPDNLSARDGDLSLCINLVNNDGTLRPLEKPTHIQSLSPNLRVLYIHKTANYCNYILFSISDNKVYFCPESELSAYNSTMQELMGVTERPDITALGNTLIFTFPTKHIKYAVFKENEYITLSDHPPFVQMQFMLGSISDYLSPFFYLEEAHGNSFNPSDIEGDINGMGFIDKLPNDNSFTLTLPEKFSQDITTPILAKVNTFISTNTDNGSFLFPFFVRYALRLYDGTLIMHSYPVLMIPNSYLIMEVIQGGFSYSDSGNFSFGMKSPESDEELRCRVAGKVAQLQRRFLSVPTEFKYWEDLIQSIDIFISAPIYTYDQNGNVEKFSFNRITSESSTFGNTQTDVEKTEQFSYIFHLPRKKEDDIQEEIENCSIFYHLESIPFNKIKKSELSNPVKGYELVSFEKEILKTITNQEVMTDDYNSHNYKSASSATVYNNRLNLAGIKENIIADVYPEVQYPISFIPSKKLNIYTHINSQGMGFTLKHNISNNNNYDYIPRYLFFPHTGATATKLVDQDSLKIYTLPMREHSGLNGSVYFRGFGTEEVPITTDSIGSVVDSILVHHPNKVYTSEIDNPFVFNPSNINTIGAAPIHALSTVTQAISQGQFGQFPLYAFTEDGIWALEVNAVGGWTAKHPISRDVITPGTRPLSLDNAIAFLSQSGLMLLQGGTVTCISKNLTQGNAQLPPIPNTLNDFLKSFSPATSVNNLTKFKDFPTSGTLAYDYAHQRIYLFADMVTWIYSLRSGTWSHSTSTASVDVFNPYPECIFTYNASDATHIKLLDENSEHHTQGLMLTRPLTFGSVALRTVYNLITLGHFSRTAPSDGTVQTILYASPDRINYAPIASSAHEAIRRICGTPYRAHALLHTVSDASKQFSITGTSFTVTEKQNHKLR